MTAPGCTMQRAPEPHVVADDTRARRGACRHRSPRRRSITDAGPTKQRAPMRTPSPTNACAADLARMGSTCALGRDTRGRMDAGVQRRIRDAAASRRARKWRADSRRPAPAPARRRGFRVEDDRAGARVRELRDVLGIGEETRSARGPACDSAATVSTGDVGIAAQLAAETYRQFAERHGHGAGAARRASLKASRAASPGAERAPARRRRLRRARLQRLQHRRR